ncbi:putative TonB-dependent receptor [Cellvibrio japonicus Ueda107]|uniref:Putative TonB-dependent receptor n=1 Tax=Cellvibrio japonicus (strain Ueda107) TaxID=498211 RepID=B3PKJ1_CELJU|nr:putative TonB-dependent receptor [Cellvibrio japonicus Ueda107]
MLVTNANLDNENGADQSHIGAGMKLAWQINPQWLAQAHYTHFKDMPDTFFREADTMGSLGLNYNRSQWNWSLSAAYHSERQYLLTTNQLATLDSYWYINTQLGYQLGSSTTIILAAKNALDKDYASPPQGAGLVGGVPNRGREISVGVNWDFN